MLPSISRGSTLVLFACLSLLTAAIWPSLAAAQAARPPVNTHALVYSTTAAELFFTPVENNLTHIRHNGADLGSMDTRSLWVDGLDPSREHRFELRGVASGAGVDLTQSPAAVVTIFTGDFVPPVYRVDAVNTDASASIVVTQTPVQSELVPDAPQPVSPPPPAPSSAASIASACNVSSISDLVSCANQANQYDLINIRQNLRCTSGNCCPSGNALINLRNTNNLTIEGNGTQLLRSDGQRRCSLVDVVGGQNINIQNWILDDDINTQPCQVDDNCPRMLHLRNAGDVKLDNVTVLNGKGYTIYVDQVNGFQFTNSRLINSGVLGLYIGHGNRSSTNVRVENSTFIDNQTNALALLGVSGSSPTTNRVANNRFLRNHRRGQWPVAPQYGTGLTGGGQVYLAQASGVTFENNTIRDGYCDNCFVQNRARSGVTGLELGIPGRSTVSQLTVRGNLVENHDGFGVHSNRNSQLPGNVVIENNQFLSNYVGIELQGGRSSNNQVSDTKWFQSFEGSNDLSSEYQVDAQCPGASVQRQCGTSDARHGRCVAQVQTSNDCSGNPVRLTSKGQPVTSGKKVQASAWVKGTKGQWCLVFSNGGNIVGERCVALSSAESSSVDNLLGTPPLTGTVPSGANRVSVELRVQQSNARVVIDDLKLSGY